ncbi:MAG TPA: hypothetical protein VHJ78_00535 [Actinomycetota bacterium]|nr:hypothetical protein [Actinomycetota bacterium]
MTVGATPDRRELEAVRQWRAAEQRLYPAVLNWPEGYDRYLSLVRAIVDELGSVGSVGDLVDLFDRVTEIASGAARARSVPTAGLDLDLAAGAAFCLRHREVVAEDRRREAIRRIEAARAGGQTWVSLDDARPWEEMPFPPWRTIEMHLPDGTGLHLWAEESLDSDWGVEFGVEVVRLDPETGQWRANEPVVARQTFTEYERLQEAVAELKARYDSRQKPHTL